MWSSSNDISDFVDFSRVDTFGLLWTSLDTRAAKETTPEGTGLVYPTLPFVFSVRVRRSGPGIGPNSDYKVFKGKNGQSQYVSRPRKTGRSEDSGTTLGKSLRSVVEGLGRGRGTSECRRHPNERLLRKYSNFHLLKSVY